MCFDSRRLWIVNLFRLIDTRIGTFFLKNKIYIMQYKHNTPVCMHVTHLAIWPFLHALIAACQSIRLFEVCRLQATYRFHMSNARIDFVFSCCVSFFTRHDLTCYATTRLVKKRRGCYDNQDFFSICQSRILLTA